MNCKNYQAELEEMIGEEPLPRAILSHLSDCHRCQTFKVEREHLTQMLHNLQTVNSPADFNFRVKARIRKQETSAPATQVWRKVAFLVPTALAVLVIGFVLIKTFVPQPTTRQNAGIVLPSQIETSHTTTQSPTPENPALIENTSLSQSNEFAEERLKPREIAFKPLTKPRAARRAPRRVLAVPSNLKNEPKDIISRDSAGGGAPPSIFPPGIQNPQETNRKQNGKDLLQTFGVETAALESEMLRVVSVKANSQGAKAGLEASDVVEKINGENPQAVSGSEFTELNLTVRRKDQKQEIKITAKP